MWNFEVDSLTETEKQKKNSFTVHFMSKYCHVKLHVL